MDATRFIKTDIWRTRADTQLKAVEFTADNLDAAVAHCTQRKWAVQAGGAFGVWPLRLRALGFERVYTFEPCKDNYECLEANCRRDTSIVPHPWALGEKLSCASLVNDSQSVNAGAGYIVPGNDFCVIRVDDLELSALDFLCLDVEGYELFALKGARRTIETFHPVIMVEAKKLPQMEAYGVGKEDALEYLHDELGYRQVDRKGRDSVLVPPERAQAAA